MSESAVLLVAMATGMGERYTALPEMQRFLIKRLLVYLMFYFNYDIMSVLLKCLNSIPTSPDVFIFKHKAFALIAITVVHHCLKAT